MDTRCYRDIIRLSRYCAKLHDHLINGISQYTVLKKESAEEPLSVVLIWNDLTNGVNINTSSIILYLQRMKYWIKQLQCCFYLKLSKQTMKNWTQIQDSEFQTLKLTTDNHTLNTEAYSEPCQSSKKERFAKTVNG